MLKNFDDGSGAEPHDKFNERYEMLRNINSDDIVLPSHNYETRAITDMH